MSTESSHRVLVVANRTASTPALLHEVQQRAPNCSVVGLLIPPQADGDWTAGLCTQIDRAGGVGWGTFLRACLPDGPVRTRRLIGPETFTVVPVSGRIAPAPRQPDGADPPSAPFRVWWRP